MTSMVAEPEEHTQTSFGFEPRASDGEMLLRVAKGDEDAFEEVFRRFSRQVLALARRRLPDASGAEEATQEAFASIWRSAHSFRPERGTGSAWLFAIARNAVVDGTRQRVEPPANDAPEQPSGDPSPSEITESDWVAWEVHTALGRLPDKEQTVISLTYFSEFSQQEIADQLELPLGTVKTRTRSGLSRMATLLEGVRERGRAGSAEPDR